MSHRRTLCRAPFDRKRRLTGAKICRWCGKLVPAGRSKWCGQDCVEAYLIRKSPSYARKQVYRRDRGICRQCGLNAGRLRGALRRAGPQERSKILAGLPPAFKIRYTRSLWDAHHRKAVAEGGGGCGLDGITTLCCACHQEETSRLRKRLACRSKKI